MHNVAHRRNEKYTSTQDVFGSSGSGFNLYEQGSKVSLFCNPYDKNSFPDHVIQCEVEYYQKWHIKSESTFAAPYEWENYHRGSIETFLITDTPRATMTMLDGTIATRLAHTGSVSPYHFIVLHGQIKSIKEWAKSGSQSSVTTSESTNAYYGKTTAIIETFAGWEIDCVIHDKSRERYPYCGSIVKGQEEEGEQWISLCANIWGDCQKCCDCCAIGERFLQAFKI